MLPAAHTARLRIRKSPPRQERGRLFFDGLCGFVLAALYEPSSGSVRWEARQLNKRAFVA